jgi:hypothetical protein
MSSKTPDRAIDHQPGHDARPSRTHNRAGTIWPSPAGALTQFRGRIGDASVAGGESPGPNDARHPAVTAARCIVHFAEQLGLRVDREVVIASLEKDGTPTVASVVTFARSLNIEFAVSEMKIEDLV